MLITKPSYYDSFRCLAGACPDSCCKDWDVEVDEAAAARYRGLPGSLGERLRECLYQEDGRTYLVFPEGRCPMWRGDGLCRIQAELGEDALCHTCRTFPRLTHDYGDFMELGLELSCPEAARIILTAQPASPVTQVQSGRETPEYDRDAMAVLKRTRAKVLSILSDTDRPVNEVLTLALLYGYQAQGELDGGEETPFVPEAALETARVLETDGDMEALLAFFRELEILTPQWKAMLDAPAPAPWTPAHLALARYLAERYWLQAVSDYDLYCRVKFLAVSCLLVKHLGGDIFRTAQLFSKEIENDADNVDAVLDAAYAHPAFTDEKILGLLVKESDRLRI